MRTATAWGLRVPVLPVLTCLPALLLWTGSCVLVAGCAGAPGSEPSGEGGEGPGSRDRGAKVDTSTLPEESSGRSDPERLTFRVVRSFPHDPELYTQGLLWSDGLLYESTGRYGHSALVAWDPETGEVRDRIDLSPELFGEGLARAGDELIQLTWRNGVALRWSFPPFRRLGEQSYSGEGWGLTTDETEGRLFMSDGSDSLTIRDPETFEMLDRVAVTRSGESASGLNELEAAKGWIYANVWTTEEIVRIDPESGIVTAVIDASGLLTGSEARRVDVLNGIAYRAETDTFFLTGKLWPRVFEGVFVEAGVD